jgi:NitT/TauT family transport system ATP-binding protein
MSVSSGGGTHDVPKLSVRGITKVYTKKSAATEVLHEIDFDVAPGEFVSVVGASGCGKSTLLRIVDGLIPATGGEVLIDGQPVHGPGPDRGFVFQRDSLFPWRTLVDNAGLGVELQRGRKDAAREIARKFITLVGLGGFEQYFPHELSGGMRQRANLARALAVAPTVLLMDEPFASLDAQTREVMQAELLRIWADARSTVLFVTHQIDEAVYLSDRVLVFSSRPGRLKHEIRIDLPRPRTLAVKRLPEFVNYCRTIWDFIEEEVRQSVGVTTGSGAPSASAKRT